MRGRNSAQRLGQQVEPLLDVHSPEEEQNELAGELGAFGLEYLVVGADCRKGPDPLRWE